MAKVNADGKQYTDTITWQYNGDCNRGSDFDQHRTEHGSW